MNTRFSSRWEALLRNVRTPMIGTMKYLPSALAVSLLLLLAAALQTSAVEHPGILPKGAKCFPCHADKTSGKSVHSAMGISCSVCHLMGTQGDMTTMSLAVPKDQVCSACHEKSASLQQHSTAVKGECLDCHDAHSSARRMLLRPQADVRRLQLQARIIPNGKRKPLTGRSTTKQPER